MAIDTGIAPSTLTGLIGNVIFYTANGQSLVRSRACHIKKSNSTNAILTRNKFKVAQKFGQLMQFYLPDIYPNKKPKKNNYSTNVGAFYKMLDDKLLFDKTKNSTLTIGNGSQPDIIINSIINNNNKTFTINWDISTFPQDFNTNNCYLNVYVFNIYLTKFYLYQFLTPFLTGTYVLNVAPKFIAHDNIFIFPCIIDYSNTPFLKSRLVSLYPLDNYVI